MKKVGILGAGSMGAGIAQVASQNGHDVILVDTNDAALEKSEKSLAKVMARLVEKGKLTNDDASKIQSRIRRGNSLDLFSDCDIVIEAIIENIDVKKEVFKQLEIVCREDTVLASNTSSLSIAAIASSCRHDSRVIGIHFFNPAPLMPLVEIIPAIQTSITVLKESRELIDSWGKTTVEVKDTPGFIVNRVARPFYGEALRIYEEGVADFATIDWAMTEIGGFRMGPFTLMDFIGNDVNYTVTETVFAAFYYDPRYKPSFTQKRHSEAGWYGRKSGRGYYDYADGAEKPQANQDKQLGQLIVDRITAMLMNEAIDALFLNIASREDIDLAMTKGVNYPKGLLQWADEIGLENLLDRLEALYNEYGEDRYRPSPLLRRLVEAKASIY